MRARDEHLQWCKDGFQKEAERVVDTVQKAKRPDAVKLLVALFEWAAAYGKVQHVNLIMDINSDVAD